MRIRGRLLVLAIVVAVPLAVIGAIDLRGMWQASRTQLDESVRQRAELAAVAFERWLEVQRQPLTTIGAIAAEQGTDSASFRNDLRYVVQTRPHWIDLRIIAASGETLLAQPDTQEPPPSALTNYLLKETAARNSWMVVTDRTRSEAHPIIAIAVPIASGGIVIARVDGTVISELFRDIQFNDRSVIAVFDEQGRILYRRQTSETQIDPELSGSPLVSALGDRPSAVLEVKSPFDGIRRVYGLAHAGPTKNIVVVGIPSAVLYEPARRRFALYLYFSLFAFLLAVTAAFLIARGLSRSIERLRGAALALGDGDLKARAPAAVRGEIGELGATFNRMAELIAEREERLKEFDRLKSEFVSSVSHELRTPLTTIKTLAHVLQRGGQSAAEQSEYLETITAECDRQIDLVLNLLDLSRIEAGAYKVSPARVNPAEIVVKCVMLEQHAADARQQKLQADLPSELPPVSANKHALRRVLCSLIENARKYTPDGGRITIGAYSTPDEIAFYVKDTGCGIHQDDIPHIFKKFYRGRPELVPEKHSELLSADHLEQQTASTSSTVAPSFENVEQPGIGLGLYLARSIIEQLGGRIEVESASGCGTTFTIYLPAWSEEEDDERQPLTSKEGSHVEEVTRR